MTGGLRRYGLLGDPVAHSLSPSMYRAAFGHLGIDASYEAVRVPGGDLDALDREMRDLAASGGGNVTVPHKEDAARIVDVVRPYAKRTGACNCFWLDDSGRLVGDNTDVGGFLHATGDLDGLDLAGAKVLLLGAGGAARAVAVACESAGVRRLDVHNRTAERAERLIEELGLEKIARTVAVSPGSVTTYELVVNSTSLGIEPVDLLPVSFGDVRVRFAFDLVYGRGGTEWTRAAAFAGVPATDGLSMLVRQAVLSLERWFGVESIREGTTDTMWAAARDGLNLGSAG
ncbi:MAG: shikimate dehydrogenase [Gemmatimonadetes bacterium]|nr:shikimate dehydrogenase [Gemmatimonadota bacterium]